MWPTIVKLCAAPLRKFPSPSGLTNRFNVTAHRRSSDYSSWGAPSKQLPLPPKQPIPEHPKKINDKVQFTWRGAIFTTGVAAFMLALWSFERERLKKIQRASTDSYNIGKPQLGGPWTLTGRDGKPVSSADFKGKYMLMYFGFVFCPDICPQELEKQSLVIEKLDKMFGPIVQPVFITVDPKRDDCKAVDEYLKDFHPRTVGCTGTEEEIKKVTKSFRVYYNQGIKTGESDYLVDHSIIHYFMGRNGKFKDFFGKNFTVDEMVQKIANMIKLDLENDKKRKGIKSDDDDD